MIIEQLTSTNQIKQAILSCKSYFYDQQSAIITNADSYACKFADHASVYVAKEQDNIIGFLAFYNNDHVNKQGYLSAIAIDENYRGKKIGSKLIGFALEKCKETGMNILSLEVNKKNTKAIDFYEHLGFCRLADQSSTSYYYNYPISPQ